MEAGGPNETSRCSLPLMSVDGSWKDEASGDFWATVSKTVRHMPSDRFACLSCPVHLSVLSVCNVGVLWPNGWTDQDETWHAGRPQPWPHYVRWGPSSPSPEPPFSAHVCCGQTAGWIMMPVVTGGRRLASPSSTFGPSETPLRLARPE